MTPQHASSPPGSPQPPLGVVVRRVERGDLPSLLDMVTALAAHHEDTARTSLDSLSRDVLGDASWLRVLVAEHDGRLVGYAALCPRAQMHFGLRGMDLHHLYVDPAFRGAGLGRKLIEASVEVATSLGCAFMVVGTDPQNHAAQAAYKACGFEALPGDGSRFWMQLTTPADA